MLKTCRTALGPQRKALLMWKTPWLPFLPLCMRYLRSWLPSGPKWMTSKTGPAATIYFLWDFLRNQRGPTHINSYSPDWEGPWVRMSPLFPLPLNMHAKPLLDHLWRVPHHNLLLHVSSTFRTRCLYCGLQDYGPSFALIVKWFISFQTSQLKSNVSEISSLLSKPDYRNKMFNTPCCIQQNSKLFLQARLIFSPHLQKPPSG